MNAPRWLMLIAYAFWRPWLRRRLGRVVVETVDGEPLVVLPGLTMSVLARVEYPTETFTAYLAEGRDPSGP